MAESKIERPMSLEQAGLSLHAKELDGPERLVQALVKRGLREQYLREATMLAILLDEGRT
jgi:hypothetical protein